MLIGFVILILVVFIQVFLIFVILKKTRDYNLKNCLIINASHIHSFGSEHLLNMNILVFLYYHFHRIIDYKNLQIKLVDYYQNLGETPPTVRSVNSEIVYRITKNRKYSNDWELLIDTIKQYERK